MAGRRARRFRFGDGIACLIASVLCASGTALAQTTALESAITLATDDTSVYAGDSVVVEVEAIGLDAPLDVAPLSRDADLLRETGGTRIGVVGGRVVEIRTRRMEFLPRGEGQVFFGPLSGESVAGTVRSNALVVSVLPAPDVDWSPAKGDAVATFSLSSDAPVVGERVVADLVLRYPGGHRITGETIRLPAFDGFDVLPVHESRRTSVATEDGPMREIAWRWLLFPTRSGTLPVGEAAWRGEMVRSRTQRGPFERTLAPVELAVAPALADSGWWLPAANVTLADSWSRDPRELSAGDEIVRTLTLTATDVLASQLPVVTPLESRSIASTPIGERREQVRAGDHVTSTATFEFRLHARSPVPVFLDTVRVGWWDTGTRSPDEAIVPARRIDVSLPERADLLAELALDGRNVHERAALALESLGERHAPWWASLAVLGALSFGVLLEGVLRGRRRLDPDALPPL